MEKIRPILKTFKKNGYNFKLLKQSQDVALYHLKSESGGIGYEVHKVRLKAVAGILKTRVSFMAYTHYEGLAGNEDFGKYGWSYQHYDNALKKYNELLKEEK